MKRPIWKLFVGGLAIYFGLWGTISSILSIAGTLSQGREIQTEVIGELGNSHTPSHESLITEDPSWIIAIGLISLLVSAVYLFGGVALIKKPTGQRVFYVAMAISVLWAVAKIILFTQGHSQILLAVLPAFTPSLIIDLFLAGIVFACTRYQLGEKTLEATQEPSASTDSNLSMSKVNILMITGWFAAGCLAVLPFWILGVPGVKNDFARGWQMGLDVIMYYPIAWLVVYGLLWFLKKNLHNSCHQFLIIGGSISLSLFLGLAILRLIQAFRIMAT